ncbi:MAG: hypothetical protein PHG25_01025 [Candidatus Pacebacteria bacterium]|nr:hypothetical protein [Candidatus Paceibacterota bacterium]
MKEIEYDSETLTRMFPDLKKAIENKDFKVIKVQADESTPTFTIARFPNMSICSPDVLTIDRICTILFSDIKFADIASRPYGLLGIEFVSKSCPR